MTTITDLTGTYTIDPTHSRLGFITRHAMVAKVRGSFDTFEGSGTIDGADIAKSSVSVKIDAGSINTNNADRDAHLRSADFFSTDEDSSITFVSTAFKLLDATTLEVTGDLTIKGISKQVSIPFEFLGVATDPFGNERAGFEGTTVIQRSDWGITWNAALETGGVLVSDKVTLEIEVSAIKQA
jgi:polyisoprenoid-binding protein YceI